MTLATPLRLKGQFLPTNGLEDLEFYVSYLRHSVRRNIGFVS